MKTFRLRPSWKTVLCGGGDEERRGWHEICEGWRGGMDPSGAKEEEEEC